MSQPPTTYMRFTGLTALTLAQTYAATQTVLMLLPPGITQKWADPILLADGSYVVPEYVHVLGTAWQPGWTLPAVN